jgi:phosphoglycolate phosphatase
VTHATRPAAFIFDLDGTLADTLSDIASAMNRSLRAHGLSQHALTAYRHFVGGGVRVLAERAIAAEDHHRIEQVLATFRSDYFAHLLVDTAPYPGIVDMLARLAERGCKLAVLSNKPHDATRRVVASLFADVPFVSVYGQRDEVPKKPDPVAALAIAEELGVAPARIVFVGDTAVDMKTAVGAGMAGVGCLWGFRDAEELRDAGATRLVTVPAELLDVSG